jgi:ParB family transcriptional regulator, chromosome partitioning protein
MPVKRYEKVDKHRLKFRDQARKIDREAPDLKRLADSIVTHGQLETIGLLADFTVIWGNRRALAALLHPAITHLDAVILEQEITESQYRVIQAIENFHQETLKMHEKTLVVAELKRLNPTWTNQDLAKHLSLDPSTLTRLLCVYDTIASVNEAYFAGKLGLSDCYAISKLPPEQQAEALALKLAGATRDQLEAFRKRKRNGETSAKTVSRIKIALASGVAVTLSADGLTLDAAIDAVAEAHKVLDKGRKDGLTAKTIQKVSADRAAKGGG